MNSPMRREISGRWQVRECSKGNRSKPTNHKCFAFQSGSCLRAFQCCQEHGILLGPQVHYEPIGNKCLQKCRARGRRLGECCIVSAPLWNIQYVRHTSQIQIARYVYAFGRNARGKNADGVACPISSHALVCRARDIKQVYIIAMV